MIWLQNYKDEIAEKFYPNPKNKKKILYAFLFFFFVRYRSHAKLVSYVLSRDFRGTVWVWLGKVNEMPICKILHKLKLSFHMNFKKRALGEFLKIYIK